MDVGVSDDETIEHFRTHGWMRVRGAFSAEDAAAMRTAASQGVKHHPAFRAVGSPRVLRAIDGALEGQAFEPPDDWGAAFLALPTSEPWTLPSSGWHADANYLSALSPPDGIRTHALFGDVVPRGGGTLIVSGSHRLIHRFFRDNPPPRGSWRASKSTTGSLCKSSRTPAARETSCCCTPSCCTSPRRTTATNRASF